MIFETKVKQYCKDFKRIENYEKAINDNTQVWHCHHRLEIMPFSKKQCSVKLLKEQGLYYHLSPESLIFLTPLEHKRLHNCGKVVSEETKKKIADYNRGKKHTVEWKRNMSEKMKNMSDETKKKMSKSRIGHIVTTETRKKVGNANRGRKYYNNGIIEVMQFECPKGFVLGRCPKSKQAISKGNIKRYEK